VPTRALIVFCFGVAFLGGYSLEKLSKHNNLLSRLLVSLTVLIILCDLFSVSAPTLSNAAKTLTTPFWENLRTAQKINDPKLYRIPPSNSSGLLQTVPSVHQPFTQIRPFLADPLEIGEHPPGLFPILLWNRHKCAYSVPPQGRHSHSPM
jgi:hypothetical protein